ncbi:hypothetical protein [Mumia sp. DW29H23]|uniref:hypothetical protein n=1 Tax=Mumia sp. DW29H23 TaxID=3421241 RepID=UPI003D69B906
MDEGVEGSGPDGGPADSERPGSSPAPLLDLAIGTVDLAVTLGARGFGIARAVLGPATVAIARRVAYPPLVPRDRAPGTLVGHLVARGARRRQETEEVAVRTARLTVPVVTDAVLDQIDLTSLVIARVDVATIVSFVLDQLDLTALVTKRVALGEVVEAALDDLDLTDVVIDRVDLHRVVMQVLDGLDLTELVRERVDLDALANQVIDDVDLPEIIRDSSSGVAADLVVEARSGAATADEAVARAVDRVLVWRRNRERGER